MSEIYKRIVGKKFEGVVQTSKDSTIITINLEKSDLFQIAQNYILSKNLNWKIDEPRSWNEYNSQPHISLKKGMEKFSGEIVNVTVGRPYHYETETSRWVVLECEISSKYECDFECHMSIAQEKFLHKQ
jgi:hypothetical protein